MQVLYLDFLQVLVAFLLDLFGLSLSDPFFASPFLFVLESKVCIVDAGFGGFRWSHGRSYRRDSTKTTRYGARRFREFAFPFEGATLCGI